jgi:hypothetical protein
MQGLIKIIFGCLLYNAIFITKLFLEIDLTQHPNPILITCFTLMRLIGIVSILFGLVSVYEYGRGANLSSIFDFDISLFKKSKPKNPIKTKDSKTVKLTIYHNNQIISEINIVISELSKLQQEFKSKNLDTNIFIKFNLLKDKFDKDLNNIQSVVSQLHYIGQNNNQSYLQLLNNYLDLFDKEKQIIYNHIQQQCNEELNMVNNELHDFKQIVDKVV